MASEDNNQAVITAEKEVIEKKESIEMEEKAQEAKLRAKYPTLKGPGSSAFLQKRLCQGQKKYFDSGDYNMAKAKSGGGVLARPTPTAPKLYLPGPVGSAIPTPESVPHRKSSIQSKLAGQT